MCEAYLEFPEGCGLQKNSCLWGYIHWYFLEPHLRISLQSLILNPSLFFEIKLFLLTFTTDSNFKRLTFCWPPIKINQSSNSFVLSSRWSLPFDTVTVFLIPDFFVPSHQDWIHNSTYPKWMTRVQRQCLCSLSQSLFLWSPILIIFPCSLRYFAFVPLFFSWDW